VNIRSSEHLSNSESVKLVLVLSRPGRTLPTYELANFTSIGFTDAARTLMSSSSGFVIFGTGSVARLYSDGLQNFVKAMARIVAGILVVMVLIGLPCRPQLSSELKMTSQRWEQIELYL
jgi:hypothetical protein